MGNKRLLVTDTNIWIDLHYGNLIPQAFMLSQVLVTPDVILAELKNPDGSKLVAQGLKIMELPGEAVLAVYELARKYKRPSRRDLFALVLAQQLEATLITGDKNLKLAAENEGVSVHGSLWVMDTLVSKKIISGNRAANSLKTMLANGSRLPINECQKRIKAWRNE